MPQNKRVKKISIGDVWVARCPEIPDVNYLFTIVAYCGYLTNKRPQTWWQKKHPLTWIGVKTYMTPDREDNLGAPHACWFNAYGEPISEIWNFYLIRKSRQKHSSLDGIQTKDKF